MKIKKNMNYNDRMIYIESLRLLESDSILDLSYFSYIIKYINIIFILD